MSNTKEPSSNAIDIISDTERRNDFAIAIPLQGLLGEKFFPFF
jgi:hypothetical protein